MRAEEPTLSVERHHQPLPHRGRPQGQDVERLPLAPPAAHGLRPLRGSSRDTRYLQAEAAAPEHQDVERLMNRAAAAEGTEAGDVERPGPSVADRPPAQDVERLRRATNLGLV